MYLTQIPQNEENEVYQCQDCEFLACAIHEAFGYPAIVVFHHWQGEEKPIDHVDFMSMSNDDYLDYQDEYEEDPDQYNLIHCFSYFQINDKTYFVDSLGITDDINDILKNFNLTSKDIGLKYISEDPQDIAFIQDDCITLGFKDPEDIKNYCWSTYYDFYLEEEFTADRKTYAEAFVEKYRDLLTIEPPQKLADLIAAAETTPNAKNQNQPAKSREESR